METRVTATELVKSLSDILNRVRYLGERFLIERNGDPVAILAPPSPATQPGITLHQLAARLGDLAPQDEGFAEDLEAIQLAQPRVGGPAWPS